MARILIRNMDQAAFSPAPSSGPFYPELKHLMQLKGGEDGEVARFLLEIGGLKEELVLESMSREGDEEIEVFEWTDL
ncbi:hypothetical protein JCM24511_00455 [Saitozyma sp. JCM 24511]|nr:hypothetical protein JCM24511_00455 [Saitozyma sp. JCM 24511]